MHHLANLICSMYNPSFLDLMGGTIIHSILGFAIYYCWSRPSLALACLSNASTIIPAILSDTVALTAA